MNRDEFLKIAEDLTPTLLKTSVSPKSIVEIIEDKDGLHGWSVKKVGDINELYKRNFGTGDSFTLDFGTHHVGYLKLKIKSVGSPQDAPLKLKLTLGEVPCEIGEPHENYSGWISSSWLQEEIINIDVLPFEITLPRRYAFRFLKMTVVSTSQKYSVQFGDISCIAVTSADISNVEPLPKSLDKNLIALDSISIRTLQNCMHYVFEDGPKRDRRLWIGDLRLQALSNYCTVKNYNLVKRCLYLFAGLPLENEQIGACLFIDPKPLVDDTVIFDYSLFFISILSDYYNETKDLETLKSLWPVAIKQIEIAKNRLDENGLLIDSTELWSFIDWNMELNRQAAAQGVFIYTLKQAKELSEELGDTFNLETIKTLISLTSQAALNYLYDEESNIFVSGKDKQISWASQAWLVLSNVLDKESNSKVLDKIFEINPHINMVTPYMYHHLVEALIKNNRKEKALTLINEYWGEMMNDGADCFWECYNPNNKYESPYGSNMINSYCHAWSCTPSYFIRKYFL